ncbi:MAG: hypothetical protein A3J76_05775 [Candidatus Moranbacteria bacterium RBG_13_45_13]|nr:MAG: hypothetical protein A3J76_05775 [Candidatus Moranbacteria bacterium RBG_13_45_13]
MENMLSRSTLEEITRLLGQLWKRLIGPNRNFWIEALKRFLRQDEPVFAKVRSEVTVSFAKERRSWQKFYKKIFGADLDLSKVHISERPDPAKDWWLIIVANGMTPQRLYNKNKELFPCWCWTDENLDEIVESERIAKDGHYAVWIRRRVEADEEFKNLSANDLKKQGHKGITLEERLLLELHYFWKTKKHLDIQNVTLCTASRYSSGSVPRVDWVVGRLRVHWCDSGHASDHLRSREAVS